MTTKTYVYRKERPNIPGLELQFTYGEWTWLLVRNSCAFRLTNWHRDLADLLYETEVFVGGNDLVLAFVRKCWERAYSTSTMLQNNDGRDACYACGSPVKQVQLFTSMMGVCTKCGK